MNLITDYELKDIMINCPDEVPKLAVLSKQFHNIVYDDPVMRGLYKCGLSRKMSLKEMISYCTIPVLIRGVPIDRPVLVFDDKQLHPTDTQFIPFISYGVVYAIMTNNLPYLNFLIANKCEFDINHFYVAISADNLTMALYLIKECKFIDIMSEFPLDVIRLCLKSPKVLKYILELPNTQKILQSHDTKRSFFDDPILRLIAFGNIECVKILSHYCDLTKCSDIFRGIPQIDEFIANVKYAHCIGIEFAPDEFDHANEFRVEYSHPYDNVETLSYLLSINYKINDTRIKRWMNKPKCRELLLKMKITQ